MTGGTVSIEATDGLGSPAAPGSIASVPSSIDKLPLDLKDVTLDNVSSSDGSEPQHSLFYDFKRREGEAVGHYVKRLCSEGHSVPDAFLTVASAQIGQILLTCPNALWKAGVVSGSIFMFIIIIWSLFTTYIMNALYMDRKRQLLRNGTWAKVSQSPSQYHDVLGFHAGKIIKYVSLTVIVLQLLGTGVAQVVACAADLYSINKSLSKRELQLIWGAILQLFVFFPTFRHFRILNILALTGTTMTAIYLLAEAARHGYADMSSVRMWPKASANGVTSAPQYFFTGSVVLMNALGGHAIMMEMMDAMESPKKFTKAYLAGWLWTIFLVVPQSLAINLSFPKLIGTADNVYAIMPMSNAKIASVALMIFHQLAAFAYYVVPVLFMWEKLIHTDKKPWYIRLPSRLPVSLGIWLFAMAFPFYGAINSLMAAISVPFTAFALPTFVFWWIYRKPEARVDPVLPPIKILQVRNWLPVFVMCFFSFIVFTGFGFAAISYSLKTIVDNSKTFGVFARCYQCPANYLTLLKNPGNGL